MTGEHADGVDLGFSFVLEHLQLVDELTQSSQFHRADMRHSLEDEHWSGAAETTVESPGTKI